MVLIQFRRRNYVIGQGCKSVPHAKFYNLGTEHNDKENEFVSDSRAIRIEGKTSQPPSKRRKQVKPAAVNWRKKQNLKKIPEKNFTYFANSHPHLALLEPIALFRLLFNDEIRDLITNRY